MSLANDWWVSKTVTKSFHQFCQKAFVKSSLAMPCVSCLYNISHSMTKPTKWHIHQTKTHISLCMHGVWSESLLCTHWIAKDPCFFFSPRRQRLRSGWVAAQADLSLCWVHRWFCCFCHAAAQLFYPAVKESCITEQYETDCWRCCYLDKFTTLKMDNRRD